MKVDLTPVLCDLDGNPYQSEKGDLTLGKACIIALFHGEKIVGDEAYKRHCIVTCIHGKKEVELDAADLAKVRTVVGESGLNIRIKSLVWDLLDAAKIAHKDNS